MKRIIKLSILFTIFIISFYLLFNFKCLELENHENSFINVEIREKNKSNIYSLPLGTTLNDLINKYDINYSSFNSEYSLNTKLYNNQVIVIRDDTKQYISINSATLEQLMTLPGIGEKTALNIIEYRKNNNGFISIEELMNVKGIGEKKYERIRSLISL